MPELLHEEKLEATPARPGTNSGEEWERGTKIFQYAVTIALSAFLLFQVQLILGKFLLPMFGGTPAVWNTCLLCFQILLLLGYCYGHVLGKATNLRLQGRVHATLLLTSLVLLLVLWMKWGSPLTPGREWRPQPSDNPVAKILELLGVTVALPFFLLSTTGPLLQKWLTMGSGGKSPYRLYALSNAGSLLGLLSYPFLFEWTLTQKHQAWMWSCGYIAFAVLGVGIALRHSAYGKEQKNLPVEHAENSQEGDAGAPNKWRYLLWIGLSACSTTMLLASTNLLCQDIAVIPLLWVVPLSLYLFSFILTFESNRWYRRKIFWPLYFVMLGVAMKATFGERHGETLFLIGLNCLTLFIVFMACHGELARSKPEPRRLTGFYLMVALGGALGGAFVVLVAPHIFLGFWEFQVGLIGCGFLLAAAYALGRPALAGKPATEGKLKQETELGIWTVALILLLLCQDIAVIPLLWIVPLSLYLLSCILTFGTNRWHERKIFWPLYFAALGAVVMSAFNGRRGEAGFLVALCCVTLFAAYFVFRGELAGKKRGTGRSAGFNPLTAVGGAVLGGVFIALVAPRLVLHFWEFQVGLIGCGLLLAATYALRKPVKEPEPGLWTIALILLLAFLIKQVGSFIPNFETWPLLNHEYYTGALLSAAYLAWWAARRRKREELENSETSPVAGKPVACLMFLGMLVILANSSTQAGAHTLFRERNFFGAKAVLDDSTTVMLVSGSTVHGFEYKDPAKRRTATGYFREESGVARILRDYPRGEDGKNHLRVGVIGMGAGTLVAYGRTGDVYRFYEIDPAMIALSVGTKPYFHFVQDSAARVDTVLGDARLSLEIEAAKGELQKFDVLVVDAFSSDSIPVHLLTREATGVYLKHLRGPDGVLAFHISNRYLDLDPVIVALSQAYGLHAVEVWQSSKWILMSANPEMLRLPDLAGIATPVKLKKEPILWTDDYSNLFEVVGAPQY